MKLRCLVEKESEGKKRNLLVIWVRMEKVQGERERGKALEE